MHDGSPNEVVKHYAEMYDSCYYGMVYKRFYDHLTNDRRVTSYIYVDKDGLPRPEHLDATNSALRQFIQDDKTEFRDVNALTSQILNNTVIAAYNKNLIGHVKRREAGPSTTNFTKVPFRKGCQSRGQFRTLASTNSGSKSARSQRYSSHHKILLSSKGGSSTRTTN